MKKVTSGRNVPPARRNELLGTFKERFEKNAARHPGTLWEAVQARLEANVEKLWSLNEMETSGGEPDIVGHERGGPPRGGRRDPVVRDRQAFGARQN